MNSISITKLLASVLLLLASGMAFAAELTFTSPSSFANNGASSTVTLPLHVSGTASAEAGVALVSVSILDTRTAKWWSEDGWSEAWAGTKATVLASSATEANWNVSFNLQDAEAGSGSYLLIAGVNDALGVYHSNEQWQRYFSVAAAGVEAGVQYNTPVANQSVTLPLKIEGAVTSPTGVAEVSLAIMDLSNYQWWNSETGAWSESWVGAKAVLSRVDATRSNWHFLFDPREAAGSGRYRVFTGFSDAAWVYSATTWERDFIGFEANNTEQGIQFTYPESEQAVPLPLTLKGSAASASGVAEVSLSILDLETYKWWNNGRWSDDWTGMKADISSHSGNVVNWQYTFDARDQAGSGRYRVLTGISDLNWQYLTDAGWTLDFTKQESGPVEEVSPGLYQLKDLVEYDWLVGCVPTAAGMMIGYWDRNGYGGLITGDSTRHSQAIDDLIFSQGHLDDYLQPTDVVESFDDEHGIIPDKSESVPTHRDNSLGDFVSASHSRLGLDYGWSRIFNAATGIHGWTSQRGYGGFTTAYFSYRNYTFEAFRKEILAGRPMMLSVDVRAGGNTDHLVLGVAFNDNTQEIGVLNGWNPSDPENPPVINWIKWHGLESGWHWGIGGVITVTPPAQSNLQGPNTVLLERSTGSKVYYRDGVVDNAGNFNVLKYATLSNLGSASIGIASADGHRFWQLYNDGYGTAALYQSESQGDGKFSWVRLSRDSGLNRTKTVGFASADGKTFWQLWDDGVGSLALVRWSLDATQRYLTNNQVVRRDTGLSRANTLGAAMQQDGRLWVYVKEGTNQVALYELDVNNQTASPRVLRSNVQGMDRLVDFASFVPAVTVASDGDGSETTEGVVARPSALHQRLAAKGNQLDNWGIAQDDPSEEFGGGARVIPAPSANPSAEESSTSGASELNQSQGGSGAVGLWYLWCGLLLFLVRIRVVSRD